VITVDVVFVNLDERTAFCSDGVTRSFKQMFDSTAQPTEDPDEAIAAVIEVEDGKFILLELTEESASVH
jgi:hypothetical protein